jgi:dimethyladenosine transferase 1
MILGTYNALENILRFYFTKRRKTIGHITRRLGKELPEAKPLVEEIESIIDFKARPEDIPTEQFCDVAKLLYKHNIIKLPLV